MEIWIVFFWSLKSLTKEESQPTLKCKKSLIDFLLRYSGFGAMQRDSLWTCQDLETGSNLHDFSAWTGSWQDKLHSLQSFGKRTRWILAARHFVPGREKLQWGEGCEWTKGGLQIKTDWYPLWICRGNLLTFMSPKAIGCKESEIYTMRS